MFCVLFFFFYCYGAHRDLHVLTHSFPPLRSSDLAVANIAVAYRRRGSERSSGKLAGTNRARKRAPRRRGAPFTKQEPERAGRLLDPVTLHPLALHLAGAARSEEHTSELQSLMRISYAVFCLKNKHPTNKPHLPAPPHTHNP